MVKDLTLKNVFLNRYPDGRRGAFRDQASFDGDEILFRICASLPDEEGLAAALEGLADVTRRYGEAQGTEGQVPTGGRLGRGN